MATSACRGHSSYQAIPISGPLFGNVNLDFSSLNERIGEMEGTVYCYIVRTVMYRDGRFVQTGSGPNFQGGLITLCSCKHQMRTSKDPDAWNGVWIAGIAGAGTGAYGRDHLFYLMRVGHAFESQRNLWQWLTEHAPEAAQAKRADRHQLGDVYRPQPSCKDPYDPDKYVAPCSHHVHLQHDWYRKDIDYVGFRHRRPALLVGDPDYSFLWSEPRVRVPFRLGIGSKKCSLGHLLQRSHDSAVAATP
ncbi:MAG: hypothetical protein OJF49_004156 [Ktedonobacterales bacterium]|nr:MAG: hypothetical protein OJF49_004156 [Ktedonobacterales bacterium]